MAESGIRATQEQARRELEEMRAWTESATARPLPEMPAAPQVVTPPRRAAGSGAPPSTKPKSGALDVTGRPPQLLTPEVETYRTEIGDVRMPSERSALGRRVTKAPQYIGGTAAAASAAATVYGDPYPVNEDDIRASYAPKWYDTLMVLEPFDYSRRYAWNALAWTGQALPEEGMAAKAGRALFGEIAEMVSTPAQTAVDVLNADPAAEAARDEVLNNVGARIYDVIASGAAYERSQEHRGELDLGGLPFVPDGYRTPNLTGRDMIDLAITKQEAQRLSDESSTPEAAWAWSALATDPGREAIGMAMEIVADPLWVLGPAAGSKLVYQGGKGYRISSRLQNSASSVSRVLDVPEAEAQILMINAVHGQGESKVAALETLERAAARLTQESQRLETTAKRAADTAADLPGSRAQLARRERDTWDQITQLTADYGKNPADKARLEILKEDGENLSRVAVMLKGPDAVVQARLKRRANKHYKMARRADNESDVLTRYVDRARTRPEYLTGHATPAPSGRLGSLAAIHYGPRTKYLTELTDPLIRRQSRYDPTVAAARGDWDPNKIALRVRNGERLTDAESMMYAAWSTRPGRAAKTALIDAPQYVWNVLARHLGGRYFQPFVIEQQAARTLRQVSPRTGLVVEDAAERAPEPLEFLGVEFLGGLMRRIKRTTPEMWSRYQEVLSKYTGAMTQLQSKLLHDINRTSTAAARVLKKRRAQGGIYASKEYGVVDIINEAGDLIERGAGMISRRPELRPVVESIEALVQRYSTALPVEELRQAVQAIARTASGDDALYKQIVAKLRETDQIMRTHVSGSRWGGALLEARRRWRAEIDALGDLARQNVDDLALVLDMHAKKLAKMSGESLDEITASDLRRIVVDAVGGDAERARQLLQDLGRLGRGDPAKGISRLRELLNPGQRSQTINEIQQAIQQVGLKTRDWKQDVRNIIEKGEHTSEAWQRFARKLISQQDISTLRRHRTRLGTRRYRELVKSLNAEDRGASVITTIAARTRAADRDATLAALREAWDDAFEIRERGIAAAELTTDQLSDIGVVAERILHGSIKLRAKRLVPFLTSDQDKIRVLATVEALGDPVFNRLREVLEADVNARASKVSLLLAQIDESVPKVTLPDLDAAGKPKWRAMDEWEHNLWNDFQDATQHLDDEDTMLAAFGALRAAPANPQDIPDYERLAKRYDQILGQRLADMPVDILPVIEHLRRIVKGYEQLYEASGFTFAKTPLQMAKRWGVVDYIPHLEDQISLTQRGKLQAAVHSAKYSTSATAPNLDAALSVDMRAAKKRALSGTMGEINASVSTPIKLSLDPSYIMSRYMDSNRAVSAKELLLGLMRTGVAQVVRAGPNGVAQEAAARDLVPLLSRPDLKTDIELLIRGDLDAWGRAGIGADEIDDAIKAIRRGNQPGVRATWLRQIPEMRAASTVEENLLLIKKRALAGAGPMFDPEMEMISRAEAWARGAGRGNPPGADRRRKMWQEIAEEFNRLAADAGATQKTDGKMLATYFAEGSPLWSIHVPASVQQSMKDMLELKDNMPAWLKATKTVVDRTNNFFKVRMTIINTMFHTRNAVSNALSNILSLGARTAMSPKLNFEASTFAAADAIRTQYGTFREAAKELRKAKQPGESAAEYARRQFARTLLPVIERWSRDGFDLGDGVLRSLDETLDLMQENSVLSGAFTQFVDIGRFEQDLAATIYAGDVKGSWAQMSEKFSRFEDALIVTTGMAAAGGLPGAVIVMPKWLGRMVGQQTENHARVLNFLGELRRTGSIETASASVQKFLFDYNDLTAFQKTWMRTLIPFFTWTAKNLELQMNMVFENPMFYQRFQQLLIHNGPRISAAWQDHSEGRAYAPRPWMPWVEESYTWARVRFPWPWMQNAYIQGLGTPVEAAVDVGSQILNLLDPDTYVGDTQRRPGSMPNLRWLAQSTFVVKMLAERAMGHSFFYDRPIDEMTTATEAAQLVSSLRRLRDIPGVGFVAENLAGAISSALELTVAEGYRSATGTREPFPIAEPFANHLFLGMPWRGVIKNAAAAADTYHHAIINPVKTGPEGKPLLQQVPAGMRYLDAMYSLKIVQDSFGAQRGRREYQIEQETLRRMNQRRQVRGFERPYVDKR